jgi:predicted CopG family antitoxin
MAAKTISLELDAYEKLRRAKRTGEAFSGVVRRARFGPADASGRSIIAALEEAVVRESDREAAAYWEDGTRTARTVRARTSAG